MTADGVHLTRPATNRLVANMQLSLGQGETCAYSDHPCKNPTQDSPAHLSATVATTTVIQFGRRLDRKPKGDSPEDSDLESALPFPTGPSRQLDLQRFKVALSLTQSLYPAHQAGTLNISSAHPPDRWRHVSLDKAKWPCPMPHTDGHSHTAVTPTPTIEGLWHSPEPHLPISDEPAHAPTHSQDTQCQLCLGWGHLVVTCKSRESKCFACSNYGHFARACPLATQ